MTILEHGTETCIGGPTLPQVRRLVTEVPGPNSRAVAERQRGVGPLAFIAGADGGAFVVVHQRQVDRRGHGALPEFNRGAYVNQRRIAGEDLPNILWD